MSRSLAALLAGLVIGAAAAYFFLPGGNVDTPAPPVRDIANVAKVSVADAEKHRKERYANIGSITDVLALPSQFAQSEALHALAGRVDPAGIQALIFEASRIADDVDRQNALGILFLRLTELDAATALALARTDFFVREQRIEQGIWFALARIDLDAAIDLARSQPTRARQKLAAQALLVAHGYLGNPTTDYIVAELGIKPDRNTRRRYLYMLADRSPEDAVDYINSLASIESQKSEARTLAWRLSETIPNRAGAYARRFVAEQTASTYETALRRYLAQAEPAAVLEQYLASGLAGTSRQELYAAITEIAAQDIEQALRYYERMPDGEIKRSMAANIAKEWAAKDVDAAIAWARQNEQNEYPFLMIMVMRTVADSDPEKAMEMILSTDDTRAQNFMLEEFGQALARNNPSLLAQFVDRIPQGAARNQAFQGVIQVWVRNDPDAAIDWALQQDDAQLAQLLQLGGSMLIRADVHAAMRLLDRIPEEHAHAWRQQIAHQLARSGDIDEAMSFVSRFEGQPDYEQLQGTVIAWMAEQDSVSARQLADQLADGFARDAAHMQIISQRARTNPAEAASWLGSIADESMRGQAAGSVANQWYALSPAEARRWLHRLPAGPERDHAISGLLSSIPFANDEDLALIRAIRDPELRGRANLAIIHRTMERDPIRARQLVNELELTDQQRQQAEELLLKRPFFR